MSTLQVSRLESLILDKICSLEYVTRVGYRDDGQEVVILVFHDDVPSRYDPMISRIVKEGGEIEYKIPDRMISPLSIQDGPDVPVGIFSGYKTIYVREAAK